MGKLMFISLVLIIIVGIIGQVYYLETQEELEENLINSISLSEGSLPEGSDIIGFEYTTHDDGWYFCEILVQKPVYVCTDEEKRLEPWRCKSIPGRQAWCNYWYNLDTNKTHQVAGTFNSSNGVAWWDER